MSRGSERSQARGRRATWWGLAIFFAVQLGVGAALDYVWPDLRFDRLPRLWTALHHLERPPDVLCLGSSRMGTTFRQQLVQTELREETGDCQVTTFNATVPGSDLMTAKSVLLHILRDGIHPRVVVL